MDAGFYQPVEITAGIYDGEDDSGDESDCEFDLDATGSETEVAGEDSRQELITPNYMVKMVNATLLANLLNVENVIRGDVYYETGHGSRRCRCRGGGI